MYVLTTITESGSKISHILIITQKIESMKNSYKIPFHLPVYKSNSDL